VCSETAREILALLLEIASATPARLADELGRSRSECGRELALLQHRGLVAREPGGPRRLTEAGAALVATLF
jgi:Mn-dependent DtxR family transcriptional regulator